MAVLLHQGRKYYPGDTIELPDKYVGKDFLEPLNVITAKVKLPKPQIESAPISTPLSPQEHSDPKKSLKKPSSKS